LFRTPGGRPGWLLGGPWLVLVVRSSRRVALFPLTCQLMTCCVFACVRWVFAGCSLCSLPGAGLLVFRPCFGLPVVALAATGGPWRVFGSFGLLVVYSLLVDVSVRSRSLRHGGVTESALTVDDTCRVRRRRTRSVRRTSMSMGRCGRVRWSSSCCVVVYRVLCVRVPCVVLEVPWSCARVPCVV